MELGNLEWLEKVESEMQKSARTCEREANSAEGSRLEAQIAVNNATYKEVAHGFTSPGMTKEELIERRGFTIDGVHMQGPAHIWHLAGHGIG